jgi:hypothetical protein
MCGQEPHDTESSDEVDPEEEARLDRLREERLERKFQKALEVHAKKEEEAAEARKAAEDGLDSSLEWKTESKSEREARLLAEKNKKKSRQAKTGQKVTYQLNVLCRGVALELGVALRAMSGVHVRRLTSLREREVQSRRPRRKEDHSQDLVSSFRPAKLQQLARPRHMVPTFDRSMFSCLGRSPRRTIEKHRIVRHN